MNETPLFIDSTEVGYIFSKLPITGSVINNFEITEVHIKKENDVPLDGQIKKIISLFFKVPGSPRLQQIWDFKDVEETKEYIVIRKIIFKAKDLCIACNGTGKFQALRHKALAKCPVCKGNRYTNNIWNEETKDGNDMVERSTESNGTSGTEKEPVQAGDN